MRGRRGSGCSSRQLQGRPRSWSDARVQISGIPRGAWSRSGTVPGKSRAGQASRTGADAGVAARAWDFATIRLLPPRRPGEATSQPRAPMPRPFGTMQPPLVIGRADDPLEREADRVARGAMQRPATGAAA